MARTKPFDFLFGLPAAYQIISFPAHPRGFAGDRQKHTHRQGSVMKEAAN
jgi:hypothetical protein